MTAEVPTPKDPSDAQIDKFSDRLHELTPESADYLRFVQMLLAKNGVKVNRDEDSWHERQQAMLSSEYILDSIVDYTPNIDKSEVEALGLHLEEEIDEGLVEIYMSTPIASEEYENKRLLADIWINFSHIGNFIGLAYQYYTIQEKSLQKPMMTIYPCLYIPDHYDFSDAEKRSAVEANYQNIRKDIGDTIDEFGCIEYFNKIIEIVSNISGELTQEKLQSSMSVFSGLIDYEKMKLALENMVERND